MSEDKSLRLCVFLCFLFAFSSSSSVNPQQYDSFLVSSFSYPETKLNPYDWIYLRVDLPSYFSSVAMNLMSTANTDKTSVVVCIKDGSPPVPDLSHTPLDVKDIFLNGTAVTDWNLQATERCTTLQKNITLTLTNEQIHAGAWYIGVFNGIGPVRTQSKMINRGKAYIFHAEISIEGCTSSTMWGKSCNQSIIMLSCAQSDLKTSSRNLHSMDGRRRNLYHSLRSNNFLFDRNPPLLFTSNSEEKVGPFARMLVTPENVLSCKTSYANECIKNGKSKIFLLAILGAVSQMQIFATNIQVNQRVSRENGSEILVKCFIRHELMPTHMLYDQYEDIGRSPLTILLPKLGRWFMEILVIKLTMVNGTMQEVSSMEDIDICFSLEWKIHECPNGKAGPNCRWENHRLQRDLRKGSSIFFESHYLPTGDQTSFESANFPLEPLLSNSSFKDIEDTWTYFSLDIPHGAAGGSIHVQMTSDEKINYEIYGRFNGIPSTDVWDYYANTTFASNASTLFPSIRSNDKMVDFYILYPQEGTWNFGVRHPSANNSQQETILAIGLEKCPRHCSDHGTCRTIFDKVGLTFYSFCYCDRRHGGFDCSNEIISHSGHIWQSISLIATNAACILPAFWSFRHKALSEMFLFTFSGISSGLYHACDVGTWCAFPYSVLQFMDFWLSFMAVVSTFVCMTMISEVWKRAILTLAFILTAFLAEYNATSSFNIVAVLVFGAVSLLIGWLIEYFQNRRYRNLRQVSQLDIWLLIKQWVLNLVRSIRRFRWPYLLVGFIFLALAIICWKLESTETYWIWHSLWHVTIYSSSFFFLCSIVSVRTSHPQEQSQRHYELARQNSITSIQQ